MVRKVFALAVVMLVNATASAQLPSSSLAVRDGDRWLEWWNSDTAPVQWDRAHMALVRMIRWREAVPGLEWAELSLRGHGEARRLLVVLVRLDPRVRTLSLDDHVGESLLGGRWKIELAPRDARLALNTGQFRQGLPWGWVVVDGEELLPPERAPLGMALLVDSTNRASLVDDASIDSVHAHVRPKIAFQSYPALLVRDGEIPAQLRAPGRGVNVEHRDARLAVGEMSDGRLLIALTRFDGLGEQLGFVPFGLTVPEMAALMGALGCRRAMLLDGGISAQLLLRDTNDRTFTWRGLRAVPLGLIAH